ncbi:hypothetical protein CUMW_168720, partial [Citrus unshiu]
MKISSVCQGLRSLFTSSIDDRNRDISRAFMEENFLITETLFSCPQIKFEYEAKYQMQIYGLLSERQSSMLSVVWVKVIGASSSSTTHNR